MRRSIIAIICACSMLGMTGCADLRESLKSKETQGMILGALVGAAIVAGAQYQADHHTGDLGAWVGGGAIFGGLVGWYVGHNLRSEKEQSSAY